MDTNILTTLLIEFKSRIEPATGIILPYAKNTLFILITIDLALVYIMALIKEEEAGYKPLLVNILKYGAFVYLVLSYHSIATVIMESFAMIGLKAGGNLLSVADLSNPSKVAFHGLTLTKEVWENVTIKELYNPFSAIMILISVIAINIAFFVIGLQIFVTTIEFGIVAALGLILVPFGVWKPTSFIFDKIKDGIINFGIKYMVLSFVVSISIALMNKWAPLAHEAKFEETLIMAFGASALAYLCYHAPAVASGLSSGGSGNLGGMAMVGGIVGAAGSVKRGAETTAGAVKDGAKGVYNAAKSGVDTARIVKAMIKPPTIDIDASGYSDSPDTTENTSGSGKETTTDGAGRQLSGVSSSTESVTSQAQPQTFPRQEPINAAKTVNSGQQAVITSQNSGFNNQPEYTDTGEVVSATAPRTLSTQAPASPPQISGVDLSAGSTEAQPQRSSNTPSGSTQLQQPQQAQQSISRGENQAVAKTVKDTLGSNFKRGIDGSYE